MSVDFESIHNQYEQTVFAAVLKSRSLYPVIAEEAELLADVACVALNRLPSRYIRHRADYAFYLTESEAAASELALNAAVKYAFEFVQARVAMRVRA
ncbi:MAG: late competence development ComFB family protein [Pseudomonadota bacterium]